MRIYVHPEARPWVPDPNQVAVIRNFFDEKLPNGRAFLWPARLKSEILGRPASARTFRAFTRGSDSHVFVDRSETKPSVAFVLSHELTHQLVDRSPVLSAAFDDARPAGLGHAGDPFHAVDAEERFCDGIAARLFPGTRYDRSWWRRRVG